MKDVTLENPFWDVFPQKAKTKCDCLCLHIPFGIKIVAALRNQNTNNLPDTGNLSAALTRPFSKKSLWSDHLSQNNLTWVPEKVNEVAAFLFQDEPPGDWNCLIESLTYHVGLISQ